jgi:hypothetical protein
VGRLAEWLLNSLPSKRLLGTVEHMQNHHAGRSRSVGNILGETGNWEQGEGEPGTTELKILPFPGSQSSQRFSQAVRPSSEWTAEDWQAFFDERAGIAEHDRGLPRPVAEARAFECCVVEWLNRNPARGVPGRCLGCGAPEHVGEPLLPLGTEASHVWLHSRCWEGWYAGRRDEAVAALSVFGIVRRWGENAYGS